MYLHGIKLVPRAILKICVSLIAKRCTGDEAGLAICFLFPGLHKEQIGQQLISDNFFFFWPTVTTADIVPSRVIQLFNWNQTGQMASYANFDKFLLPVGSGTVVPQKNNRSLVICLDFIKMLRECSERLFFLKRE